MHVNQEQKQFFRSKDQNQFIESWQGKTYVLLGIEGLFIILILSSCTAPVYFKKTLPPEIRTGTIESTAGFANRYDYTLRGPVREKYRACYQFAASEFCRNMKEVFEQSELFKVRVVDTLLPGIARSSLGTPLSPDSVISRCKENKTPFLMVLESLNFWITGEKAGGDEEDSKMLSLRTQNVYLVLKAGISLYSSSGDLLHQDSITYRALYKTRLSLTSEVWIFEPSLKESGPSIIALTKSISEAYYNKFLPRTITEMRTLYAGKGFRNVMRYIKEENWDESIKRLLPIASSSESKLASQAAYNLSVLYEIKGNMSQSEFWLNKSGGKKPQEVVKFNY